MIAATDISLQFGERVLFKEISFRIGPRDRIGLVGSNGTGKTTLLRILVGQAEADSGTVNKAKYVTVGYLAQEGTTTRGRTLYGEAESVFGDIIDTQSRLDEVHRKMGELTDHESEEFRELLDLYGELQHKLESSDAFRMKGVIEKVLKGLGFRESDFERDTGEFSGGWQMRIALAKLLLQQPSLLLLDEPTNHLDLESLQWLEEYLQSYEGALIIVSHDRRFLDTMAQTIFELSMGTLSEYAGNFTAYQEQRALRLEQQIAAFENQQAQIKQTQRFIERFRYKATKARQVQSRIKMLERMELVQLEDEEGAIDFEFPPAPPSGKVAMELLNIAKSYDSNVVFEDVSLDIYRGDRLAFVGVNGAGKSTLSRIIAGVEPFESGTRNVGHNVIVSYFAQHQAEELDPGFEVLQTVESVAAGETRRQLRSLLGSFLFHGDDVFKKVRVLSGGEKSRLALAKMLLIPANLLVMDEPTNHLDMRSKGVLQDALEDYDGSFVIVSHDRDFLDPIINKVVEFTYGRIRVFPGTLSEYLDKKKAERAGQSAISQASSRMSVTAGDKERKRQEAALRQERYRATKPIQEKIEAVEKTIAAHEAEKADIERLMSNPSFYKDGEKVKTITARYKEVQELLNNDYFRWGELTKRLEEVQATFRTGADGKDRANAAG
ncbi:MAG TPA: ATP-binding cassette domain-containing protein [Bacteroidota bacterium]|nr:ATP-binding cassette domain-containing protein [Bacteroidota bacterium]